MPVKRISYNGCNVFTLITNYQEEVVTCSKNAFTLRVSLRIL